MDVYTIVRDYLDKCRADRGEGGGDEPEPEPPECACLFPFAEEAERDDSEMMFAVITGKYPP